LDDGRVILRSAGALHEGEFLVREAATTSAVLEAFAEAREHGRSLTLMGARRSFGGQAFPIDGGLALDIGALDRGATVLSENDDKSAWIRVGGGTRFIDLHRQFPRHRVRGTPTTDTITVAGALASCCHNMTSYLADSVRALTLLTPAGERIECRAGDDGRAGELFRLAIGSLGALGAMTDIELKLEPIEPEQHVQIESRYAGPAAGGRWLDVFEQTRDDPRYDEGAGAVVYGVEGHAIVVGERLLPHGVRGTGARAPLTNDAHVWNAFTQGIANRFPGVARRVVSRTYRQGASCWSDWYGFAFFQRSYDLTPEVLSRPGPIYALARAIGVDPRLPILHQTWFFPRAELRKVMQLYWEVMRRYPGVGERAEQQDLVLLPPSRWPMHSLGARTEPIAALTSSFAVRSDGELGRRTAACLREFSHRAHAELRDCRVSLCKQLHCDAEILKDMHADWITAIRRARAHCDPAELLGSHCLAQLGVMDPFQGISSSA
jgi:hypothetical protein